MDEQTLEYYNRNAHEVAARYDMVDAGVALLFPRLFRKGDRVLDVGAGSGRDCARLISFGIDSHGIEPAANLFREALARHPELAGRLHNADLLSFAKTAPEQYDGILMSAVLMHIPDEELSDSVMAVRSILRDGGKLVVATSLARTDVSPETERDRSARLYRLRSETEISLIFERLGFTLQSRWESDDALGRIGFEWLTLVFTRIGGGAYAPV